MTLPSSTTALSPEEHERYARHIVLPEVGLAGQARLKASRVLLIGAGGLGSPAALYLAAAGIGTLGLVDGDVVDASNLQRQLLHGTSDVGRRKTESAAEAIRRINPNTKIERHDTFLDETNALDLVSAYDIVVDGTDNFTTRYLVNDACVLTGTPNAYGSIFRFEGQASLFCVPASEGQEAGPCYRCLHPEPPPSGLIPDCSEGGVFGVLPGMIGTLQATEAVKWCLGIGEGLRGRLLVYDALGMNFRTLRLRRNPDCQICGDAPTITSLRSETARCATPKNHTESAPIMNALNVEELHEELNAEDAPILVDVREDHEREVGAILPSLHIPLGELPERLEEIPKDGNVVVYCKIGGRSARAIAFLEDKGFHGLRNLTGGITAWSARIDASIHVG